MLGVGKDGLSSFDLFSKFYLIKGTDTLQNSGTSGAVYWQIEAVDSGNYANKYIDKVNYS